MSMSQHHRLVRGFAFDFRFRENRMHVFFIFIEYVKRLIENSLKLNTMKINSFMPTPFGFHYQSGRKKPPAPRETAFGSLVFETIKVGRKQLGK